MVFCSHSFLLFVFILSTPHQTGSLGTGARPGGINLGGGGGGMGGSGTPGTSSATGSGNGGPGLSYSITGTVFRGISTFILKQVHH